MEYWGSFSSTDFHSYSDVWGRFKREIKQLETQRCNPCDHVRPFHLTEGHKRVGDGDEEESQLFLTAACTHGIPFQLPSVGGWVWEAAAAVAGPQQAQSICASGWNGMEIIPHITNPGVTSYLKHHERPGESCQLTRHNLL